MKIHPLVLLILLIFVISCKNNDKNKDISSTNDSENDSIELPKIKEQLPFTITTIFDDCGEWGGHMEKLILESGTTNEIQGTFIKYKYNCDSLDYYYSLKRDSLPIEFTKKIDFDSFQIKSLEFYFQKFHELRFDKSYYSHSGFVHSLSYDTIHWEYYGYKLIEDYTILKRDLKLIN